MVSAVEKLLLVYTWYPQNPQSSRMTLTCDMSATYAAEILKSDGWTRCSKQIIYVAPSVHPLHATPQQYETR